MPRDPQRRVPGQRAHPELHHARAPAAVRAPVREDGLRDPAERGRLRVTLQDAQFHR
jgi:hypothetical protein